MNLNMNDEELRENTQPEDCSGSCESCGASCPSRKGGQSFKEPANSQSRIGKVIAVVSGKGGVGKSLVTAMLAGHSARSGKSAAVLDADITGPSIPRLLGVGGQRASATENALLPVTAPGGIKVMSVNLLLENDSDPVIWRGPVIAGVVRQFWTDVVWGDVDYMFVDMPPGTGDVPLTVFQSLPVDGVIIVATPQELVGMIVEKAVNMAEMMNIPVLGLVENMSYYVCPDCGNRHALFGESHAKELAARHKIPACACLPFDPAFARQCDEGGAASIKGGWLDEILKSIS